MKILKFLRDTKSEAKKVTWTGFAETRMLTIIVALLSTFIALYLLLIDNVLQKIIDFIVKF